MKPLGMLLALGLAFALNPVHADDKAPTAQQNKMAACNKEAGDRKGDARKQFMSQCLSAKPAAAEPRADAGASSCEKMAADKNLHGAAKGSFMKKCERDAKGGAPKK